MYTSSRASRTRPVEGTGQLAIVVHNARVTTPERALIQAAAKKMELTFPAALVDVLETLDLDSGVDPEWALYPPAAWERLRETVEELFDKEWKGLPAVVIGENQEGSFVCLVQEGDEVGPGVHLLDQKTLGLELIAEDAGAWFDSIGAVGDGEGDEDGASDPAPPADEEPAALPPIDANMLSALLGDGPDEPEPEPSPQLKRGVEVVLAALEKAELVELDGDRRPMLVSELCAVVGEARSPKDFMKRFVRTLVHSDNLEEVYGTDGVLRDVVKGAMDS